MSYSVVSRRVLYFRNPWSTAPAPAPAPSPAPGRYRTHARGRSRVVLYRPNNSTPVTPTLPTIARPAGDVSAGAWQPNSGASLSAMLDETSPDSSDYIFATAANTTCEVALNPVTLPAQTRKRISYQVWSPTGGGLRATLKQGAATVASWTHASLPTVPTRFDQYLTDAQVALITDASALTFTFTSL